MHLHDALLRVRSPVRLGHALDGGNAGPIAVTNSFIVRPDDVWKMISQHLFKASRRCYERRGEFYSMRKI